MDIIEAWIRRRSVFVFGSQKGTRRVLEGNQAGPPVAKSSDEIFVCVCVRCSLGIPVNLDRKEDMEQCRAPLGDIRRGLPAPILYDGRLRGKTDGNLVAQSVGIHGTGFDARPAGTTFFSENRTAGVVQLDYSGCRDGVIPVRINWGRNSIGQFAVSTEPNRWTADAVKQKKRPRRQAESVSSGTSAEARIGCLEGWPSDDLAVSRLLLRPVNQTDLCDFVFLGRFDLVSCREADPGKLAGGGILSTRAHDLNGDRSLRSVPTQPWSRC